MLAAGIRFHRLTSFELMLSPWHKLHNVVESDMDIHAKREGAKGACLNSNLKSCQKVEFLTCLHPFHAKLT